MTATFFEDMLEFRETIMNMCLPIAYGSRQVQNKIIKQSKFIKIYCCFTLLLSIVSHLVFLPFQGDEEKYIFYYDQMERCLGKFNYIGIFLLAVPVLVIFGINMNKTLVFVMYIAFQTKYQLDLLNDFLKNQIKNSKDIDQDELYRRISKCAEVYKYLQK